MEGKSNTACDEVESMRKKWTKWRMRNLSDEREASLKNFAGSGPFGNCRKDLHRFPLSLEEAIAYGIDFLRLQCRYLLSVISRDFQNLMWTTRCFTTFGLEHPWANVFLCESHRSYVWISTRINQFIKSFVIIRKLLR